MDFAAFGIACMICRSRAGSLQDFIPSMPHLEAGTRAPNIQHLGKRKHIEHPKLEGICTETQSADTHQVDQVCCYT